MCRESPPLAHQHARPAPGGPRAWVADEFTPHQTARPPPVRQPLSDRNCPKPKPHDPQGKGLLKSHTGPPKTWPGKKSTKPPKITPHPPWPKNGRMPPNTAHHGQRRIPHPSCPRWCREKARPGKEPYRFTYSLDHSGAGRHGIHTQPIVPRGMRARGENKRPGQVGREEMERKAFPDQ